jgi:phage-related protein
MMPRGRGGSFIIDEDAILVVELFEKKTRATPHRVIADCQRRLRLYDQAAGD